MFRAITLASLAIGALAPSYSQAAVASAWSVGQEREVDEGYYFKLLKVEAGWRLWRIETKEGVECRAVKSAAGQPHPVPLGFTVNFEGGEPFIILYWSDVKKTVLHAWEGEDVRNASVQVRPVGNKFWNEEPRDTKYHDGARLEVNVMSWEYPEIRVGYHEAKGLFDLTGIDSMRAEIERCR